MSSCDQSYGSFDDNDDADDAFFAPDNSKTYTKSQSQSYASVLSGKSKPKPVKTVNTATTPPETVTISDHHTVIAGLQAEVSIAKR